MDQVAVEPHVLPPPQASAARRAPPPRPEARRRVGMTVYLIALMLPVIWLLKMSFQPNPEITSTLSLWPHHPTSSTIKRSSPTPTGMAASATRSNTCSSTR